MGQPPKNDLLQPLSDAPLYEKSRSWWACYLFSLVTSPIHFVFFPLKCLNICFHDHNVPAWIYPHVLGILVTFRGRGLQSPSQKMFYANNKDMHKRLCSQEPISFQDTFSIPLNYRRVKCFYLVLSVEFLTISNQPQPLFSLLQGVCTLPLELWYGHSSGKKVAQDRLENA